MIVRLWPVNWYFGNKHLELDLKIYTLKYLQTAVSMNFCSSFAGLHLSEVTGRWLIGPLLWRLYAHSMVDTVRIWSKILRNVSSKCTILLYLYWEIRNCKGLNYQKGIRGLIIGGGVILKGIKLLAERDAYFQESLLLFERERMYSRY